LLQEELLARIAARRILCKILLQEELFARIAAKRILCKLVTTIAITLDSSKESIPAPCREKQLCSSMVQEHRHTDTDTERETEKLRVVDEHIHARIVGDGEACRGDWNHTRKAAAGHQFALVPLSPMCLYRYTAARRGRWLRQLQ
jgi:hypothetical protein